MSSEPLLPAAALSELLGLAHKTVRVAGDFALQAGAGPLEVTQKSSASDLVTQIDKETERLIVEHLLGERPDDGIAGEEGTSIPGTSGIRWHIDPIDGTSNYVYGQPGWSVSIAAEVLDANGEDPFDRMAVGVVFDPRHDDLYSAARGQGAQLNGQPIKPRVDTDLASLVVATGFSYDADIRRHQIGVVGEVLMEIGNIRRFGSAAVDLCLVACGRVDAYYEAALNLWDRAAGALIAAEAGALVHDLTGAPPTETMTFAASPSCHDTLKELLVNLGARRISAPS